MNFMEGRLLGVGIDESGREASLSIIDTGGAKFIVELHGVERLLVHEFRQQNVIEELIHWKHGRPSGGLQEAAFFLTTGVAEKDCDPQMATVARAVVDRVVRGELEMMEITAVFGAQILASFASMTVCPQV
ncbi:hypothetical protein ACG0Z6_11745 [Roseateles sp. BYS180W]|uniref:Uncharacterized protein n=1 Tax=Roseateles rivi TaxID=3299028 RepID=A0ABW7FX66_9BURK